MIPLPLLLPVHLYHGIFSGKAPFVSPALLGALMSAARSEQAYFLPVFFNNDPRTPIAGEDR